MTSFLSDFETIDFPLFNWVRLPEIYISESEHEYAGTNKSNTHLEFLTALARIGYRKHRPNFQKDFTEYVERIKKELALLDKLGFVDYVILMWRIVRFCEEKNIARDYGRGSCAGSLVFFFIGITSVDPIKYDLFFERFVSEARTKLRIENGVTYINGDLAPDVDLDIEQTRRGEVVEFLKEMYPGKVCKISTMSTLSGKSLIKEIGKIVGGYSEEEMKKIADLIPKKFGVVEDIEKSAADKGEFSKWCENNQKIFSISLQLRDLIRNKGSHPSGFIVSREPISKIFPLELVNTASGDGKEPAASYSMEYVAKLAIKVDLLGVRCCSVVARVLKLTGEAMADINIDNDPLIYDQLQELRTPHGIFQLEAPTNLQVANKVKPRNLSELSDVVAMARPGALSFVDSYIQGEDTVQNPLFSKILKNTRYVCLYQEQAMQLCNSIGFTLDEGEQIRRCIGKKKKQEMLLWKDKVDKNIKDNNLDPKLGELLWKILSDSADYSFNRSHSVSYAALAALTIYLKYKHPSYFYLALFQEALNEPKPIEEIGKIHSELHNFGIKLLPPDLLKSKIEFSLEGRDIRFGLSGIKGISEATIDKLKQFQHKFQNKFEVFEAASNSGLSIGVFSALIQSGCLDETLQASNRALLTLEAQFWNLLNIKEKTWAIRIGQKHNYALMSVFKELRTLVDDKSKPVIRESRLETIRKKFEPLKAVYDMNRQHDKLARYFYEKTLLGYNYSVILREIFDEPYLIPIAEVKSAEEKDLVKFVAYVADKTYEGKTKANGTKYIRLQLADETGSLPCFLFDNSEKSRILEMKTTYGRIPQENDIVFAVGKKNGDAIFLEKLSIQTTKIYTKYKETLSDKKPITNTTPQL